MFGFLGMHREVKSAAETYKGKKTVKCIASKERNCFFDQ